MKPEQDPIMIARVLVLGASMLIGSAAAQAQKTCPLLVPREEAFLQPKRLPPAQVPAKNAAGCLSPADAIYAPDGCPLRLCPRPTRGIEL
ncbi:MAG: hypothetical protein DCF24_01775 [Cyanobium sp.]|nr:MAG: hypothetical protein DCF24_01775 [Cyanobium sp.]